MLARAKRFLLLGVSGISLFGVCNSSCDSASGELDEEKTRLQPRSRLGVGLATCASANAL